jgi:hypothetical protein
MRERRIAAEFIERFDLDLAGLTVLTEAASGPYLATPLTAAIAGAERVLAVTDDSEYASGSEVADATKRAAEAWDVADRIEIRIGRHLKWFGEADIVTNSGFVRPIDAEGVQTMKPTAVIPLMWETWEFRPDDLDLDACREREILVLGTCESRPPCDMRPYSGQLALQLLRELGIEASGAGVVLLGGHETTGIAMREALAEAGARVAWFADEDGARPYDELAPHLERHARVYDALLVAEHEHPIRLLAPDGLVGPEALAAWNPALRVGVIAGNVDAEALRRSGLRYLPERIRPFGYESYETHRLGVRPVLELYTAGLKVGEAMARARLRGAKPVEAAREALSDAPAMDFRAQLAWT